MTDTISMLKDCANTVKKHIGMFVTILLAVTSMLGSSAWWVITSINKLDKRIVALETEYENLESRIDINRNSMKVVWEKYSNTNDRITDMDVNIKVNQKTIDIITDDKLDLYNPNEVVIDISTKKELVEVENDYMHQQIAKSAIVKSELPNTKKEVVTGEGK